MPAKLPVIQRGCVGFEAFTADEKSAGMFETQHRAATTLRELAALPCPDGDAPGKFIA
jgi:hypothetical protein